MPKRKRYEINPENLIPTPVDPKEERRLKRRTLVKRILYGVSGLEALSMLGWGIKMKLDESYALQSQPFQYHAQLSKQDTHDMLTFANYYRHDSSLEGKISDAGITRREIPLTMRSDPSVPGFQQIVEYTVTINGTVSDQRTRTISFSVHNPFRNPPMIKNPKATIQENNYQKGVKHEEVSQQSIGSDSTEMKLATAIYNYLVINQTLNFMGLPIANK